MLFFSTMVSEVRDSVAAGKIFSAFAMICCWALLPILTVGCGAGFIWVLYSMVNEAFSYGAFYGIAAGVLLVLFLGAAFAVGKAGGEGLGNWLGDKLLGDAEKSEKKSDTNF